MDNDLDESLPPIEDGQEGGVVLAQGGHLTIKMIERISGLAANEWLGKALLVVTEVVDSGIVAGRTARGMFKGPINQSSELFGQPLVRHAWIETSDGEIIDVLRWAFEGREPYIFVGTIDSDVEYSGNDESLYEADMKLPPEVEVGDKMRVVPERYRETICKLLGVLPGVEEISLRQALWLGTRPLELLGEDAHKVYLALSDMRLSGMIPQADRIRVLDL